MGCDLTVDMGATGFSASLQPAHRIDRAIGQGLVLSQERTVDVGDDKSDAGHD